MPGIQLRVSGGDFSNLIGTTGRGIAAGMGRAREIDQDKRRLSMQEDAAARVEEDREKTQGEEQAEHDYLNQRFSGFTDSPEEVEAHGRLPLKLKWHLDGQKQQEATLQKASEDLDEDFMMLGSHASTQEAAEQLQEEMQRPGADIEDVISRTKQATAKLEADLGTERRAMGALQKGFAALQMMEDTDPESVNPRFALLLGRMQTRLEAQGRGEASMLSEARLEDDLTKLSLYRSSQRALDQYSAEIAQQTIDQVQSAWEESAFNPDADPDRGKVPVHGMPPEDQPSLGYGLPAEGQAPPPKAVPPPPPTQPQPSSAQGPPQPPPSVTGKKPAKSLGRMKPEDKEVFRGDITRVWDMAAEEGELVGLRHPELLEKLAEWAKRMGIQATAEEIEAFLMEPAGQEPESVLDPVERQRTAAKQRKAKGA